MSGDGTVSGSFRVRPDRLGALELTLGKELKYAIAKTGREMARGPALALLRKATQEAPPASPNGGTGAVASGKYLKGWRVEARGFYVRVRNLAPYAAWVEQGRRAGAKPPPVMALVPWVRLKLGVRGRRALSIAFAIARQIARRGLRARRVLERSLPALKRLHTKTMNDLYRRALREAAAKERR